MTSIVEEPHDWINQQRGHVTHKYLCKGYAGIFHAGHMTKSTHFQIES